MGQGERALLRDDRVHTAVEPLQQQAQGVYADARVPARQGVGADEHNGARGRRVKRLPDPHGMTAQDVPLQEFYLVWWGRGDRPCRNAGEACHVW
jgi:hypothetical protein